jgi:hypothetical protein
VPAMAGPQARSASLWWLTWEGWRDVAAEYVKHAYYYLAYASFMARAEQHCAKKTASR